MSDKYFKETYSKNYAEKVKKNNLFFSLSDLDHIRGFLRWEWDNSRLWTKDHHHFLIRLMLYYKTVLKDFEDYPSLRYETERTIKFLEEWIEHSKQRLEIGIKHKLRKIMSKFPFRRPIDC